jgi:malonate-semialdehyde dehydrogenase (acetylating)/methylmalonate-semialdehyde dehydrogenase
VPAGGAFAPPVIFDHVDPKSELARDEIFGPVLAIVRAGSLDEAIQIANQSRYGNASSIFTRDGRSARTFAARKSAPCWSPKNWPRPPRRSGRWATSTAG